MKWNERDGQEKCFALSLRRTIESNKAYINVIVLDNTRTTYMQNIRHVFGDWQATGDLKRHCTNPDVLTPIKRNRDCFNMLLLSLLYLNVRWRTSFLSSSRQVAFVKRCLSDGWRAFLMNQRMWKCRRFFLFFIHNTLLFKKPCTFYWG